MVEPVGLLLACKELQLWIYLKKKFSYMQKNHVQRIDYVVSDKMLKYKRATQLWTEGISRKLKPGLSWYYNYNTQIGYWLKLESLYELITLGRWIYQYFSSRLSVVMWMELVRNISIKKVLFKVEHENIVQCTGSGYAICSHYVIRLFNTLNSLLLNSYKWHSLSFVTSSAVT